MLFLRFNVRPNRAQQPLTTYKGAQIVAWIDVAEHGLREECARTVIKDLGWNIEYVEESYQILRENYIEGDENLAYLAQAEIDGEVFVVYPWK